MKFLSERPDKAVLFKGSIVTFDNGQLVTEDKELIEKLSKAEGVKAEEVKAEKKQTVKSK